MVFETARPECGGLAGTCQTTNTLLQLHIHRDVRSGLYACGCEVVADGDGNGSAEQQEVSEEGRWRPSFSNK